LSFDGGFWAAGGAGAGAGAFCAASGAAARKTAKIERNPRLFKVPPAGTQGPAGPNYSPASGMKMFQKTLLLCRGEFNRIPHSGKGLPVGQHEKKEHPKNAESTSGRGGRAGSRGGGPARVQQDPRAAGNQEGQRILQGDAVQRGACQLPGSPSAGSGRGQAP